MTTRQEVAEASLLNNVKLFMESRSAANEVFVHAFAPTRENVGHYLDNFFPRVTENVACGETGTAAVGMQVASIVSSTIARTKAGQQISMFPNEHSISMGLYHTAKRFELDN